MYKTTKWSFCYEHRAQHVSYWQNLFWKQLWISLILQSSSINKHSFPFCLFSDRIHGVPRRRVLRRHRSGQPYPNRRTMPMIENYKPSIEVVLSLFEWQHWWIWERGRRRALPLSANFFFLFMQFKEKLVKSYVPSVWAQGYPSLDT